MQAGPSTASQPVPALPGQSLGQSGQSSGDKTPHTAGLFADWLATAIGGDENAGQSAVATGQRTSTAAPKFATASMSAANLSNPLLPVMPQPLPPATQTGAAQLGAAQSSGQQGQAAPPIVTPQAQQQPSLDLLVDAVSAVMTEVTPGVKTSGAPSTPDKPATDEPHAAKTVRKMSDSLDVPTVGQPAMPIVPFPVAAEAAPVGVSLPGAALAAALPVSNSAPIGECGDAGITDAKPGSHAVSPGLAEQSATVTAEPHTLALASHDASVAEPAAAPVPPDTAACVLSATADVAQPAASPATSSQSASGSPAHHASLAPQVAPALISLARAPDGAQRMTLRLDPPELGQVQIRIERPPEAPARVEITVEKPETLTLLLRDQPQLQRALDQAGVPPDGRSVTFHMSVAEPAPRSDGAPLPASAAGLAGSVGNGSEEASRHGGNPHQQQANTVDDTEPEFTSVAVPTWLRAGLDITA